MTESINQVIYYFPELMKSLKETAQMLGIAIFIGGVLGLIMGTWLFLTRHHGWREKKWVHQLINGYVNFTRSFPFLLLVVVLIPLTRLLFGTAFGPLAASFPLSIVAIGIYARLVEQVLLDIPEEVSDVAHSLGATDWQFIYRFLWLEGRSGLILGLTSMMISMVSYSTVMGVVGGGGIGDFAIRYGYQRYEYSVMYTAIIVMIVLVGLIQVAGTQIAKKLDKRKVGK